MRLGSRTLLAAADIEVRAGEVVGVIGPNGAGKTTMLRAGLGLLRHDFGEVELGGQDLSQLSERERARRAGYLPQDRHIAWNVSALRLVMLGRPWMGDLEARAVAAAQLDALDLGHLADRGVLDLSGGERARVLLARLLATEAPLLVADEPVAGLDPDTQLMVLDRFRGEARDGRGVVLTLHDLGLAARACDRLVVMLAGRTIAEGPPRVALTPETLRTVFGVTGHWLTGDGGQHLVIQRASVETRD